MRHLSSQPDIIGRQNKLIEKLKNNTAVVLFAGNILYRNADVPYPFRAQSDYYYFTGLSEPNSFLVLGRKDNTVYRILVIYEPTFKQRQWSSQWSLTATSPQLSPYDVYSWQDSDTVFSVLKKLAFQYISSCNIQPLLSDFIDVISVDSCVREKIDELRVIKDSYERECIETALSHTASSLNRLLESPYGSFQSESDIAALWHHYGYAHQLGQAYQPIIAGGKRACTLHYQDNTAKLKANQDCAVLMDAGYEYNYYASDITRMIFLAQPESYWLDLYQIVLRVQNQVIQQVKPGATLKELQKLTFDLFLKELKAESFFKSSANYDDLRKCYMHGIGHHLGLDVHDCPSVSKERVLEEGMVITIEPGLYFNHELFQREPWYNVGIRIEDDILITANGMRNLTHIPKSPEEIFSHV